MKFTYRAYDQEGKIVSGSIDAIHEQEVLDKLGAKDLLVVGMKKDDGTTTPVANKKGLKVPLGAMCAFTRQLSTMLRAGLPLVRCLESMSRNTNHRNLGLVLRDLAADVQNGDSLSDSLARHPQAFSSMFVAMVRAGEDGGILPDVLDRLASYLEMSLRLRSRIRSAMTYPIIVSTMGIGICIFMVTMIIPVFVDIFKEFDKALPLPTLILISSSSWIRGHLLWCIGG